MTDPPPHPQLPQQGQQFPPPAIPRSATPYPGYYQVVDPSELYYAKQGEEPGYLHKPARDNPHAITAFSFAICGLGLLVLSSGIAFLVALPMGIVGIVLGRRGTKLADDDTRVRHRNYARAGWVLGIVTTVLAAVAGVLFILVAAVGDLDEDTGARASPAGVLLRLGTRALGL